jgi:hypothetical protein
MVNHLVPANHMKVINLLLEKTCMHAAKKELQKTK